MAPKELKAFPTGSKSLTAWEGAIRSVGKSTQHPTFYDQRIAPATHTPKAITSLITNSPPAPELVTSGNDIPTIDYKQFTDNDDEGKKIPLEVAKILREVAIRVFEKYDATRAEFPIPLVQATEVTPKNPTWFKLLGKHTVWVTGKILAAETGVEDNYILAIDAEIVGHPSKDGPQFIQAKHIPLKVAFPHEYKRKIPGEKKKQRA